MIQAGRGAPLAAALAVLSGAGTLLSGCSTTELAPAPDVVAAHPQLFANGPGAAVTEGSSSSSPDQTVDGPLWWFTSPEGTLSVFNGSDESADLRVSADVVVPCETPARIELSLPGGHKRTATAAPGQPGRVRFGVPVPARGQVDIGVRIEASECTLANEPRTFYAGLLSLRARAVDVKDDDGPPSPT
jgi:hypothetical protein